MIDLEDKTTFAYTIMAPTREECIVFNNSMYEEMLKNGWTMISVKEWKTWWIFGDYNIRTTYKK